MSEAAAEEAGSQASEKAGAVAAEAGPIASAAALVAVQAGKALNCGRSGGGN